MPTLKFQNFYGMDRIISEKVMDKLDIFQYRFGKIEKSGWWDLETKSAHAGNQFTLTYFKEEC